MSMRPKDTSVDRPLVRPRSLAELIERPPDVQRQFGYGHTVREIDQQPETWIETARRMEAHQPGLADWFSEAGLIPSGPGSGGLVLTGSGSSLYVGDCLIVPIQRALLAPVSAVPSGELLTHLDAHLAAAPRGMVVSFARSGDSPESSAVVDEVLAARPAWHHLIITCNGGGRLARYAGRDGVRALVLDDRTCDRSLVMTSSFTNMTVAGSALAWLGRGPAYRTRVEQLAAIARRILHGSDRLAAVAQQDVRSAVFLGTGARQGSARESALKMLEMTDGRVHATAETYLGLRHGPMCAIRPDTLVVCFLSSDTVTRAYEMDLIRELNRKQLGIRLLVGEAVPDEILRDTDCRIECPGLSLVGDDLAAITDVVVGQLLALFRCLALGLRPDAPSNDNVINRVVEEFAIHRRHAPPTGC
jgi:D-galactosamine 6-phosphate deaminase/isomerase